MNTESHNIEAIYSEMATKPEYADVVKKIEEGIVAKYSQMQIPVAAGFDIISFDDILTTKLNRFIEVKTFRGNPNFHWSVNEIRVSKIRAEHYFLYLVDNDKIKDSDYEPTIIKNPSVFFIDNEDWIAKRRM